MPQLAISILTRKVPLNGSLLGIAGLLPGIDFCLQNLSAGNASVQTLPTEDAHLDLSHIDPTRVLGRVVELHSTQEFLGSAYPQARRRSTF